MDAPESEAGTLALSGALLTAGAVAGAAVGAVGVSGNASSDAKQQAAVAGGLVGVLATGFGGLLLEEFQPESQWRTVGGRTALIGVGAITLAAAFGVAKSLTSFRSELKQAPQLPRSSPNATGGTAYTAGSVDNGRTLTMAPGDTVAVSLATPPTGQAWMWQVTGTMGVLTYSAHTAANGTDVATFTASAPGSGQLVGTRTQTTPATGQQLESFTINVNVVGTGA